MATLHVTLAWNFALPAVVRNMVRAVSAVLCLSLALTFYYLAFSAFESDAMFRSGLEIPEAPAWMIAGFSFALAGIAEAICLVRET